MYHKASIEISGDTQQKDFFISINKEYFRDKFKIVFEKWQYKIWNGMDLFEEKEFMNDLIKTLSE